MTTKVLYSYSFFILFFISTGRFVLIKFLNSIYIDASLELVFVMLPDCKFAEKKNCNVTHF